MFNLKELYFSGCFQLENISMIILLRCATNLEVLNIKGCPKITKSVINVAIQVTKLRTNNIVLELHIDGKNVDTDEIKKQSPILHLHIE